MSSSESGQSAQASGPEAYDLFDHTHRFAGWAAARAAGRGFGLSSVRMIKALPKGLIDLLRASPSSWPKSEPEVDLLHKEWCEHIRCEWGKGSYGRAAKFLNVYLKCRLVLTRHHDTPFAQLVHPPLDRYLLRELANEVEGADGYSKALWKKAKWTILERDEYFEIIESLRKAGLARDGFWKVEYWWDPYKDPAG